jgi:alpha-tubulin suppressor-like RCC1 family protein
VLLEKTGYGNLTGIITMMAVGSDHSLLLNSEGQVFSFGSGIKGRLGHGDQDIRFIPTKIESLERTGKIVSLAAGGSHSLVLNEEGQVFSFGGNDRGQLGLGDTINRLLPELLSITGLRRVVAISAGHIHSLFLDIQGQVFGCGCHKSGQLGHKKNKIVPTLINLTHLDSPKIIAISAGYNHSLLLSAKGQVFSFGSNISGQLGLGLSSNILRCTHLPTLMTYFQTRRIISISAGRGFSLFLDDQGEYFGVGSNSLGELGCHVTCDFVTPILINSIP